MAQEPEKKVALIVEALQFRLPVWTALLIFVILFLLLSNTTFYQNYTLSHSLAFQQCQTALKEDQVKLHNLARQHQHATKAASTKTSVWSKVTSGPSKVMGWLKSFSDSTSAAAKSASNATKEIKNATSNL